MTVATNTHVCFARSAPAGECHGGQQQTCPAGEYCPIGGTAHDLGKYSAGCARLPRAGERCSLGGIDTIACEVGSRCHIDRCVRRGMRGDACSEGYECFSGSCRDGACGSASTCTVPPPPPPPVTCPRAIGVGRSLGGFDDAASIGDWIAPSSGVTLVYSASTGHFCPGSLRATIEGANAYIRRFFVTAPFDFTARTRLHAWLKLAEPVADWSSRVQSVRLYVSGPGRQDPGPFIVFEDAAAMAFLDLEWHEMVVDLDATVLALDRIEQFGIIVNGSVDAPEGGTPSKIDLYIDDIWLE